MSETELGRELGTFRAHPRAMMRQILYVGIAVGAVGFVLVAILEFDLVRATEIGAAVAVASMAGGAPVILAMSFFQVTRVFERGLRAYNLRGHSETTSWPAISRVEPSTLFGLKYIAVTSRESTTRLLVPLFLADMAQFRSLVVQRAGSEHILSRSLESNS